MTEAEAKSALPTTIIHLFINFKIIKIMQVIVLNEMEATVMLLYVRTALKRWEGNENNSIVIQNLISLFKIVEKQLSAKEMA